MNVVTRFAPSPTGSLHIGGARTALFNMLFARHHNGKFLLRIEDTDKKRSTDKAINIILRDLEWLDLRWDKEPVYQSNNYHRHREIVDKLIKEDKAYKCYATKDELDDLRQKQINEGIPYRYDGRWRNKEQSSAPINIKPVIRLKSPLEGQTIIKDMVQGEVKVDNKELDDMILLRSDGTPTFMLAVVVDDHDMGITHIIRGDDHLTNAFRQKVIFDALNWPHPKFCHVPLIHGPDGKKLSKRHDAVGADIYRKLGYLPEAIRNYLLRLGWSHGNDEIISDKEAIEWFDVKGLGKSSAKFDKTKLTALNAHYIKQKNNYEILELILPMIENNSGATVDEISRGMLLEGMNSLKNRSKTLSDIADQSLVYVNKLPLNFSDKAKQILNSENKLLLSKINRHFNDLSEWTAPNIENWIKTYCDKNNSKLGNIAQPIRAAITGSAQSPPIFEVMAIFGKKEVTLRINQAINS